MTLPPPLQVNLVLNEGKSLGLMIRGGAEYSLGIYITGVDKGSEAESTGLKVRVSPERAGAGGRALQAGAAGPCWHVTAAVLPLCPRPSRALNGEVSIAFLGTAFQGRFFGCFGY